MKTLFKEACNVRNHLKAQGLNEIEEPYLDDGCDFPNYVIEFNTDHKEGTLLLEFGLYQDKIYQFTINDCNISRTLFHVEGDKSIFGNIPIHVVADIIKNWLKDDFEVTLNTDTNLVINIIKQIHDEADFGANGAFHEELGRDDELDIMIDSFNTIKQLAKQALTK